MTTLHSPCIGSKTSTFAILDKHPPDLYNIDIATLIGVTLSIQIENLTPEQVEMLDAMWACESSEEYLDWYNLLDEQDQAMADVLQRLVILETMEEMLEEVGSHYMDVRAYLKKFQL